MAYPTLDEAVEWRIPVWKPAVESTLTRAAGILPPAATVLEIGYNSGMMSCYMAGRYGWHVIGYDIRSEAAQEACDNALRYGVNDLCEFRTCLPEDTLAITGPFDAVFLKSVLYHIADVSLYRRWLDWLHGVLSDTGVVMAVENGAGGMLDRLYRKVIRRSRWADFLLFDRWAEAEFNKTFRSVDMRYFGRVSQFFIHQPAAFSLVRRVEARFFPPDADHCFVAAIVARK